MNITNMELVITMSNTRNIERFRFLMNNKAIEIANWYKYTHQKMKRYRVYER